MIGEQLRWCFSTAHPLPKQQVRQYCYINSDLENIEQEDRAEPLHARILQDILNFPVAQIVEHGASNAKIMGSIPRESKRW